MKTKITILLLLAVAMLSQSIHADVTVWIRSTQTSYTAAPRIYATDASGKALLGAYPGKSLTAKDGDWWLCVIPNVAQANIQINNGGNGTYDKTATISNVTGTKFYGYNGYADYITYAGYVPNSPTAVAVNDQNFPDANFRFWVRERLKYKSGNSNVTPGLDYMLTKEERSNVKSMVVGAIDITTLKGVEHFTELTELLCGLCKLTSLDLSRNTKLKKLDCSQNYSLTSLNVSNCTELTKLICSSCCLSNIDVSMCTKLDSLECWNQKDRVLTSLNVANLNNLTFLRFEMNSLTQLDLRGCSALKYISGSDNELTSIDHSECVNLETLRIARNKIPSELVVRNNVKLKTLDCYGNQIDSLDLSQNPDLEYLSCDMNKLTYLDVSHNDKLLSLSCSYNYGITTLDLRNNKSIKSLDCTATSLLELDVEGLTELSSLNYGYQQTRRYLWAESFEMEEDGQVNRYYYFRLDGNKIGTNEKTIVESITATNVWQIPSRFDPSRVIEWNGGQVIRGTRIQRAPGAGDVYGDILLLDTPTYNGFSSDLGAYVGSGNSDVTFTYQTRCEGTATDNQERFSFSWLALANRGTVTSIVDLPDDVLLNKVTSTTYHNLAGQVSDRPWPGVNIVVKRYSDGTVTTTKQLN